MKKLRLSVFFLLVLCVVAGSADRSDASIFPAGTVAPLQQGIAGESIHEAPVVRGLPEMSATPGPMHVQGMQICAAAAVRTDEEAAGDEETGDVPCSTESLGAPEAECAEETDVSDDLESDYLPEEGEEQPTVTISDPLEPFNRAMYHFQRQDVFLAAQARGPGLWQGCTRAGADQCPEFLFQSGLSLPISKLPAAGGFPRRCHGNRPFHREHNLGYRRFSGCVIEQGVEYPETDVDLGQTSAFTVWAWVLFRLAVFGPSSLRDPQTSWVDFS
jgi:phospholipid-binding lipoprotein MlaA